MTLSAVEILWRGWESDLREDHVSEHAISEYRKSFFLGAFSVVNTLVDLADDREYLLEQIRQECEAFLQSEDLLHKLIQRQSKGEDS